MTKLEELIFSLTTVIVRYHDTQSGITRLVTEIDPHLLRKKSREHAIEIVNDAGINLDDHLHTLIAECTKGYPDRRQLLNFIVHEIKYLKAQHNLKTPYKPVELEEFQLQIMQLFIDCRELLKTQKDKTYTVTFSAISNSKTQNSLSGLINNAWVGNALCNSGILLIDEVLNRFHINLKDTDDEIREIAASLCMEQQNTLLISTYHDLTTSLLKQDQAKQKIIDELSGVLKATQTKLTAACSEIADLKKQKELEHSQKSQLAAVIQAKQHTIDQLGRDLEVIHIKFKMAQTEIEDLKKQKELGGGLTQQRKYPFYPSFFGFAAPNQMQPNNSSHLNQPDSTAAEPADECYLEAM